MKSANAASGGCSSLPSRHRAAATMRRNLLGVTIVLLVLATILNLSGREQMLPPSLDVAPGPHDHQSVDSTDNARGSLAVDIEEVTAHPLRTALADNDPRKLLLDAEPTLVRMNQVLRQAGKAQMSPNSAVREADLEFIVATIRDFDQRLVDLHGEMMAVARSNARRSREEIDLCIANNTPPPYDSVPRQGVVQGKRRDEVVTYYTPAASSRTYVIRPPGREIADQMAMFNSVRDALLKFVDEDVRQLVLSK